MSDTTTTVRCVCFYCGTAQENFVRIPLTGDERRSHCLQFACGRCALKMQRGGDIVDAGRVMHYYLGNTRGLLSRILTFHKIALDNAAKFGDINARRRQNDIVDMETLREKMEHLHVHLEHIYHVNNVPLPNPGWLERYVERARALGFPTAFAPEETDGPPGGFMADDAVK